jgi:hypothetical protein
MTTYTKLAVDKYEQYIAFDNDYVEIFREQYDITSEEVVTIDPDNCIKIFTYDNEFEQRPDVPTGKPYVFANEEDMNIWLEFFNSDGHQNNPYYQIVVCDGVVTESEIDY